MRSERIVTTIGDLGTSQRTRGLRHTGAPARPAPRRRYSSSMRFDTLDGMMGIGDLTIHSSDDPAPVPPSDFPAGTFDVPGSGEVTLPEITITPGPGFDAGSSGSSSPSSAPSKAAWARGDGSYILQNGDTLSGLAATYLRAKARWPEIWNAQASSYKSSHTPDKIFAGEVLAMPSEAQARARSMGLYGIGAGVLGRGFTGKQVALAAAGVVGLGALIHFGMP